MKCSACGNAFNDGVQCGVCKKHLDFGCAQLSEIGWRKLGSERRAAWKCPACRSVSPAPAAPAGAPEPASLETVLREVRDMRRQLIGLPTLIEDVKSIKDELKDLKSSCDFMNGRLDDFTTRVADMEKRVIGMEQFQDTVASLESEISSLHAQLSVSEQRTRLNNVEIKGIPLKKDENLFSIVEAISTATSYSFPKAQINYLHRVPLHGSKDKAIVVRFINRYIKEEFVASARACKTLSAADVGFSGVSQRIFVNDHLNSAYKNLLNKVKALAKERKFSYVWVKYGKIHVRKNDSAQPSSSAERQI
ncbi:Zinc finger DNA binding protein [Operophtera brumata]|uniref:Zinc finger DNA binding protein n=1 Tax=Operophtera brumata TaxID=104452 RepID=A0A0L7LM62_OPEBR|nr:Zinc finger DNA binding protein [Operophtera brumata]